MITQKKQKRNYLHKNQQKTNKGEKIMFKRIGLLLLAFSMMLQMAACGKGKVSSENSGSSGGIVVNETDIESELTKKDYGGKTFKFMYWYTPNEYTKRKVATFNKVFNANLQIETVSDAPSALATAVASGTPYDVVAMHSCYYPSLILADVFEPIDGTYEDIDLYDSSKPENGGLSKEIIDAFEWEGKHYTVGSSKSVYCYNYYYNKKLFSEAGLEDPWELSQKGEWTWDKLMEMGRSITDVSNDTQFFALPGIYKWLTYNCINIIKANPAQKSFTENLGSEKVINAVKYYQNMGTTGNKDQVSIFTKTGQSFYEGTTYSNMQVTDAYTQVAKEAARSTAFDKDVKNLGVAPMPAGPFNDTGLFPGHVPQGYAVGKGASDKSVAACYALFESRLTDTDSGEAYQMPTDVRAVIEKNFAEKPFLSQQFGFQDSAGNNIQLILDNQLGKKIMEGADVASMLSSYRNVITRTINDSIS